VENAPCKLKVNHFVWQVLQYMAPPIAWPNKVE